MKTHTARSGALCILLFLVLLPLPAAAATAPSAGMVPAAQTTCETHLARLTQDAFWFEHLVNPVLLSRAEIDARIALYLDVYSCLSQNPALLAENSATVHTLLEYFLIFSGGFVASGDDSTLLLVSLATSDDPAVTQLRDEAGLAAPPGYVFVRFYTSRESMPRLVRDAFVNDDVAGVTILTRYVAVLQSANDDVYREMLRAQTLPETVSHELIHAYVNASLGIHIFEDIPEWYNEGIAIYFSGSGTDHVVVTPDYEIISTSPDDYAQYDLNFDFLDAMLGRERLLATIKRSVEQAEPWLLIQAVDLADADELVARANAWKTLGELARAGLVIAVVVALFWLVPRLIMGKPERQVPALSPLKPASTTPAPLSPTGTSPATGYVVATSLGQASASWGYDPDSVTLPLGRCPLCGQISARAADTPCPTCNAYHEPQPVQACRNCGWMGISNSVVCPGCANIGTFEAVLACKRCGQASIASAFSAGCPSCGYSGTGTSSITIGFTR